MSNHATTLMRQAQALHRAGALDAAAALYQSLLAKDPRHVDALHFLGLIADAKGKPERAHALVEQALSGKETASIRCNLGMILGHLGRHAEAVACCRRALALRPDYPEALNNLGVSLAALGQHDDAASSYRAALAVRPHYAEAWTNLGHSLHQADRFAEAEAAFRRAIALRPADASCYRGLALALDAMDRPHEALAVLDLAAGLEANPAETDHHRAIVKLRQGRMAEGWELYEQRFHIRQAEGAYTRLARQPPWQGEALDGRSILLTPEQGLGDTIQFARYASLVAGRGGPVLLGAPRALARLLRSLPGVAQVIAEGEAVPPHDVHCPLMSLPRVFGTTLNSVPARIPYLQPEPEAAIRWASRLRGEFTGLLVGIVWGSNSGFRGDRHRSLPFAALAPLWQVPGVRWFSLQVGGRAADLAGLTAPPEGGIVDLAPALSDFAETAAALTNLDLLVTSDTAAAHLAGALGIPVWLLLQRVPDWRWLRRGETSPWYPSMRLFRQDERARWEPVLATMAEALAHRAARSRP